jgi:hypothetical protein
VTGGPQRIEQDFELTRQTEGFVPIAHLVMTTDPLDYTVTDAEYFAAEQVP